MVSTVGAYYNGSNSNVNLQGVQGDFPIKYGPKTLKHQWSISKNLRPKAKYNEKSLWNFLLIDPKALKKNIGMKCIILFNQICFLNWFWTLVRARRRKSALSISCIFWLRRFQSSKISPKSRFDWKVYLNT